MSRVRSDVNTNDLIELYNSGMSCKQIGDMLHCDPGTVKKRLMNTNIKIRNKSDAGLLRNSKMTEEERERQTEASHKAHEKFTAALNKRYSVMNEEDKKRITSNANKAMIGRIPTFTERIKRAKTHEQRILKVGKGEEELRNMLSVMGIYSSPQFALERYNIDLAIPPLAVEVHIATTFPHKIPRCYGKIIYALNHGWNILWIRLRSASDLTIAHADYIRSYFEFMNRNPSFPCEYRVIGRRAELQSIFRFNGNDITCIFTSH